MGYMVENTISLEGIDIHLTSTRMRDMLAEFMDAGVGAALRISEDTFVKVAKDTKFNGDSTILVCIGGTEYRSIYAANSAVYASHIIARYGSLDEKSSIDDVVYVAGTCKNSDDFVHLIMISGTRRFSVYINTWDKEIKLASLTDTDDRMRPVGRHIMEEQYNGSAISEMFELRNTDNTITARLSINWLAPELSSIRF